VERAADGPVDDAEAAPGQAGVDAQHTHATALSSEHLF
jgi:hypothetical protein